MVFDPIIAATRYGTGLSPHHARPVDMAGLLADLAGPDRMARVHPIDGFDTAGPPIAAFADAFRARNRARGTAAEADAIAQLADLRAQVRLAQRRFALATFARAIDAPIGLRERLTAFWADHFTVRASQGHDAHLVSAFAEDAIRPHVAGRFVDMLRAAETHPVMLRYLQQDRSVGPGSEIGLRANRGLNENLAREMLELHTLGVNGGYDQADVRQLAELLSGLTYSPAHGRHYDPRRAEPGPETVLGRSYGAEASPAVIDTMLADLAAHPATARHLARKLAAHFVADDPDPGLVDAIAATYRDTNGDLAACYGAMLDHPASWAPALQKIRPPFDFIVAAVRGLGVRGDVVTALDRKAVQQLLDRPLRVMGQPWQSPTGPDGWPDRAEDWIIPQTMAGRISWAMQAPQMLRDPLPDPREVVTWALGPDPDPAVAFAAGAAEHRADGIGVIFASAAFQRR